MADLERLDDSELERASGGAGEKYTVGNDSINVFDGQGNYITTLLRGQYFVTDYRSFYAMGVTWVHIYMINGEGWIDSRYL